MVQRTINLSASQSFFLFGARGTGKSTLLKNTPFLDTAFKLDFLNPKIEERYALRPELLFEQAKSLKPSSWVLIDEVQKLPKILDVVHSLIEDQRLKFALTGSSSRKLKRGGANLLAGRAVLSHLYPLTSSELGETFAVTQALRWGTMPKLFSLESEIDKIKYLRAYVYTYIKEEILVEQLIRNLDPFRSFLPIAAQMDGKIINYSNIANDTGVDHKTVQNYYQILADTNLGLFLEPHHTSIRKAQRQSPKFYFFDTGVRRALEGTIKSSIRESTALYGDLFESWFINECHRLNSYKEEDYRFSYLRTKDDAEIDLIVERPGRKTVLIEIKSSVNIDERHIKSLTHFKKDFSKADLICASRVSVDQKINDVWVLPWRKALDELF